MRSLLLPFGSALLVSVMVATLEHRLDERLAPPRIDVVDLQQLLTEQVAEVGREKLSADQQRAAATAYANALSTALDSVADADHAVLLVKPAVLVGAVDVTNAVRVRLRNALDASASVPTADPRALP